MWQDPDFDPAESVVYYVQAFAIPTPSWLACDQAFFGDAIKLPPDAVLVQQERAYTCRSCIHLNKIFVRLIGFWVMRICWPEPAALDGARTPPPVRKV